MTAPPAVTAVEEQDDLEELPPLDGDAGDAPDGEPDAEDPLDHHLREGNAGLDDTTGEDDPVDVDELDIARGEKEALEGGWLEEPADSPDLDLGDTAIAIFGEDASPPDDVDQPMGADEDFGFGASPERGGLDAGDEGPLDADEELREGDLPDLDADDEGDMDDAQLVEAGFAPEESVGLAWATEPWSRVGAPVALVAATAVACAGRGALVAGRTEGGATELVRIDLEGTSQSLAMAGLDAGTVRALAVEGEVVAARVDGGRILLSHDGGGSFTPITADVAAADVALVSGALWVRSRSGGLLVIHGTAPPKACAARGALAAMARDVGAGVACIVANDGGQVTGLLRASGTNDETIVHELLDAPQARAVGALLAVRGMQIAYAGRRGGVVRRNAGGDWTTHVWEGRVTALSFVDDAGTLVAATYSEADETTALVCLEARRVGRESHASVVARIGPSRVDLGYGDGREEQETSESGERVETDARVLAMAHDDARGVVWVAGGFGVVAFAVR